MKVLKTISINGHAAFDISMERSEEIAALLDKNLVLHQDFVLALKYTCKHLNSDTELSFAAYLSGGAFEKDRPKPQYIDANATC